MSTNQEKGKTMVNTLMNRKKNATLQDALAKGQVFAPCAWDCLSAHMVEAEGFRAIMLTGAGIQGNYAGYPDIGMTTADDLVRATEYMCDYSNLPVVVDADDGFGDSPLITYRLAKRLVYAGAAAFTIEDSTGFRGYNRWGKQFETDGEIHHAVVSRQQWLAKIKAAVEAVKGSNCMVIARTETKLTHGLDEAIARCNLALELGAHMTTIMGLHTLEEAKYVAERVPGHKMFPDVASRDGVPYCTLEQLAELGFDYVTCHFLEKACVAGIHEFSKHVKADQNTIWADSYKIGMDNPLDEKLFYQLTGEEDPWMILEKDLMDVKTE